MARVAFFAHDTPANIERFEYYRQDIDALRALGHTVVVATSVRQLPRHYDVLFAWWWTHALLPVLRARAAGRPSIVTGTFNFRFPDGFPGRDFLRRPLWQRLLIGQAARHTSLNLFVSERELGQCREHFRLTNGRYFPHCLDQAYLAGPGPARTTALFNLAWTGRENLVRKGIPELLEAVRILLQQGVTVRLDLAGLEGDGHAELRATIARMGLDGQVHHHGALSREEKIRMLREHEIYVQPSHFEGFGLATLEAMGCGACVVVCDVGAVREVVADCGVYAAPGSPAELASAIRAVLEDDGRRRQLQQAATARARDAFAFDRKVERLRTYLAEVGVH